MFSVLHDCKRENEDDDPKHGPKAADYVIQLKQEGVLDLSASQLEKLVYACRHHTDGLITDDPTIGVCWDADRLDLSRVGIAPEPDKLSTKTAKELIWKI